MATTRSSSILWWRTWVSQHRLLAAIAAGVVATHIATITGFWYPAVGLPAAGVSVEDYPASSGSDTLL